MKFAWLVILLATVLLVTVHPIECQPNTRRGRVSISNNGNAFGKDLDPAKLPPGQEQKALPEGQTGARSTRAADPFDEAYQLVDDEASS
jgi:hypothetical protein